MAILIMKTKKGFKVNNKPVTKSENGNWLESEELSSIEKKQFLTHLNSIQNERW